MRRALILIVVLVLAQFVQSGGALASDKYLYDSKNVVFNIGSGSAQVNCEVYKYTEGQYTGICEYTYKIFNTDSDIGISVFSVEILNGANVSLWGWAAGSSNPAFWGPVKGSSQGQPDPITKIQSMQAIFSYAILNDSPFDSSALLMFMSNYTPTLSKGALFGMSADLSGYEHATADLLTPAPEPATLSFFAVGGTLMNFARRRRSN